MTDTNPVSVFVWHPAWTGSLKLNVMSVAVPIPALVSAAVLQSMLLVDLS